MMLSRRGLIGALLAAPVVIRTPKLLMPIKPVLLPSRWWDTENEDGFLFNEWHPALISEDGFIDYNTAVEYIQSFSAQHLAIYNAIRGAANA